MLQFMRKAIVIHRDVLPAIKNDLRNEIAKVETFDANHCLYNSDGFINNSVAFDFG